ncbi:CRISPR-associated protein Csx20 [Helicobacter sp. 23-1044]
MDFHIIAILGISGKDSKSVYDKDSTLKLPLKNGAFHNSTHCLIDSFGENATYTFIGTVESIKYQNEIFDTLPQCKAIFEKFSPQILPQNDELKDIFHKILMAIKLCRANHIIIDITHGFRHQPIIASFASTLAKQIYNKKRIMLIFAKAQSDGTYCYTSLEQYSRLSIIAMSLQNFVKTLSMQKSKYQYKEPLLASLAAFSNALHANAFSQIFDLLDKSLSMLKQAKKRERFMGLENILGEVEKILLQFEAIKNATDYEKYYYLARIMYKKGFHLIAATYIHESIALYAIDRFIKADIIETEGFSIYEQSVAVRSFILTGNKPNNTKFDKNVFYDFQRAQDYAEKHADDLKLWKELIESIKHIRNDLAHISHNDEHKIHLIKNSIRISLKQLNFIINPDLPKTPKTLFILLNHELTEAQKSESTKRFNITNFMNITNEKWGNIPPDAERLDEFLGDFKTALKSNAKKGDYLLVQGDFGATYAMVRFAISLGVTPIYATTKRISVESIEDGIKVTKKIFAHERFREY